MAKAVEITFAIGAALTGGFSGAFGKAGQALSGLQKEASRLQKVSGQIASYQKMQGAVQQGAEKLNAARMRVKELGQQMKSSGTPTAALKKEFTAANQEAHRLEVALGNQRKKLGELRTELKGAEVDTNHLTSEQARLTAQSQKLADAQTRLQNSRAALQETKQKLSLNNIKGDMIKAAGLGYSLYKPVMEAAEFEHAAARLNAVAFSGGGRNKEEDAKSFKLLQEQARQLGRDTQFTAVQAAQSQENLARAGFQANEIISAMPGLLDMAAAEGMDLATAADIMASSLRGFGLEASDASRVSNILAQTSAASNSSITGLGESLKYVAPVAKGLGVSIEETNAMLGIMANAGIKGSQGGTALRAAFVRLSKEPKAVAKALGALGISARDAQGNMREIPELMQALSDKMKNMGSADKMKYLSNIFGSEAASGMLAVMESAVDGSLQELTRLNRESSGQLQALSAKTGISLEDLRAGMQKADKYARSLGISFSDLSVYTTMLAQSNIKGAESDKVLTAAFSQIRTNSRQVEKALKSYGIALKNDKGKMRDFNLILQDLNNSMKDMKPPDQLKELTKIFGRDGARAVQALMQGMSKGLYKEYSEVANSATGVSKEMADKVLNTFWGQKELAKSAISDLMITIGNVLLPTVEGIVKTFAEWTASLGKLASEHPEATKLIIGTVSAIAALNVGITALKYAWLGITLPFQTARVAMDWVNAKMLLMGKTSIWLSAKTKIMTAATKAWHLVMKAGSGLLNIGKLALYYGKQIAITAATKAWTAAQWLWNVALNANPIGLIVAAIAAAIAAGYLLYKNWDKIKAWWNSWTLKDVFAVLMPYTSMAWNFVVGKWNEFWAWWDSINLSDLFAPVKEFAQNAQTYVVQKWEALKAWWNSWTIADLFAPVKEYAEIAQAYVIQKWDNLKSWWDSWTFADVFAPVKGYALEAWSYVSQKWQEFSDWWNSWTLKDIFPESFLVSWDSILSGWEDAKSIISSGWEKVSRIFTLEHLGNVWEHLTKSFSTAKELLLSGWTNLAGMLNIDFSGFWDTLASGFATVCDTIKGAWSGVTGFIKDTWNAASDYVSGAWDWTKGLFGFGEDPEILNQEQLKAQVQDITILNKMSENFAERVAEMTRVWQPFKKSLGEGFEQLYTLMQGVADKIRGVVIPAVKELTASLSGVATEIASIVQAGGLQVEVRTPNTQPAQSYSRTVGSTWGGRRRAEGGIITQPEISLIGEAGREVIIPLERQSRGAELWFAAGRELGLITTNNSVITQKTDSYSVKPEIVNAMNIQPHANGGIFSQPHIGLVAEAGRETIIPLERQSRGAELWFEAGRELGLITTNNSVITQKTDSYSVKPEIVNAMNIQPHANGGIFSQPHIGLVAEAGREAIIPLERQSRGAELWFEAGRELGLITTNNSVITQKTDSYSVKPEIVNAMNIQPHANGGIFSQPHIGLVAEAGREAIIPLERQSRGAELWFAAGRELGLIVGNNSTTSNSYSSVNAPEIRNSNETFNPSEHNSMNVLNEIISRGTNSINSISSIISSSAINTMNAGGSFLTNLTNSMNNMNLLNRSTLESTKQLNSMEYFSESNNMNIGNSFLTSLMGDMNSLNSSSVINNAGAMPSIINALKFQPDMNIPAMPDIGSVISQTYTDSGDSYSLEDTTRSIPLWLWADRDIGGSFSSSTMNNNHPVTISPNINITVNGGESGIEQKFRQIIEEVISDLRDREERVRFD